MTAVDCLEIFNNSATANRQEQREFFAIVFVLIRKWRSLTPDRRYVTINKNEVVEVIVENSKLKDRLFDKVYESDESKMHLAEFLIGKAPKEIDAANVRPVIFGNKYNDLSFLYDGCMYIMLEEQSTECVNIAYRLLEYVVAGLRQQIDSEQILYGTKRVMFPVPKLYAVNVGIDDRKTSRLVVEEEIRLSESYMELPGELSEVMPDLEAKVHMYDFRMKEEEALQYINENVFPERLQAYRLEENELLQYAVSAASITYVQRAKRLEGSRRKNTYQMPGKIRNVADMIALLIERGVLRTLFTRKEVCDMTTAQFSREDIMRVSMREAMREDVRDEVREEVRDEVREEVRDEVRDEVRNEVRDEVRDEVKYEMALSFYKQGVNENVIAQATGIAVEMLKRWIDSAVEV